MPRKYLPKPDEINTFGATILWSQLTRNSNSDALVPVICRCGKKRILKVENFAVRKGSCLCQACSKKYLMTGPKHWRWKDGISIQSGYRTIRLSALSDNDLALAKPMSKGRNHLVKEHRLVMARILGRSLTPSEHVHHHDGNKLNNNPDNLQLVGNSEHQILAHNQTKELLAEIERLRSILRKSDIPF